MGDSSRDRLDFGRILPILAIVFVDMLGLTIILPVLHIYAVSFGADALGIGLVAAAYPLMQFVGAPLLGRLSDRYGRKPVLLISQIGTFTGFVILAGANSLWMVLLSRVIDGLSGANIAAAQAALTDITSRTNRTQALGLTGAAFGLAFILGPLIAVVTLALSNNDYRIPAVAAATYSFLSIVLTLATFRETLPSDRRGAANQRDLIGHVGHALRSPFVALLLALMFAQQFVFFGFESLLGIFTLNRLGLTGSGNAYIFVLVGVILVAVQVRYIGPWSRRHGEHRMIGAGLALLGMGLLLTAFTPEQPPPLYVRSRTEAELTSPMVEALRRGSPADIMVRLPDDDHNGIFGLLWIAAAMLPLSIGAAVLRPAINSLITKTVDPNGVGGALGLSASVVSAANAVGPVVGGTIFQAYGSTIPFVAGGVIMGLLCIVALWRLRSVTPEIPLAETAS